MTEGKARVIGITAAHRLEGAFASVPTWKEQGIEAIFSNWRGIIAPSGLTLAQIAYWDGVFGRMVKTDEWKKELENNSWDGEYLNSSDTQKFLDAQNLELRSLLTKLNMAK